MPRVLITGVTGFVGTWMTKKCPENVEYIGVGRGGYESGIMEHMNGITHIVHLAPVDPAPVLKLAEKWHARFLYCSSGIVYHHETQTDYYHNKINGEFSCQIHSNTYNIDYVIARLFTFFGDGLDDDKAITSFFNSARRGETLKVYGKGDAVRTYMHGRDLGVMMWRILFEGETGKAYDVGSLRKTTIRRLAERVSAFTGAEIEEVNGDTRVKEYVPNETRILH